MENIRKRLTAFLSVIGFWLAPGGESWLGTAPKAPGAENERAWSGLAKRGARPNCLRILLTARRSSWYRARVIMTEADGTSPKRGGAV